MWKLIFRCVLIICVIFKDISSRPAEHNLSYIEGLNIQLENDKWICGDVDCPAGSNGCKIRLQTDADNKKLLLQSFTCFDENKTDLISAADVIEMPNEKSIDIDIESYKDAVSVYSTGFGFGGHESAKGIVAPGQWNNFKEESKRNRQGVGIE